MEYEKRNEIIIENKINFNNYESSPDKIFRVLLIIIS